VINISNKKGIILGLAIYIVLIAAITSVGMYAYAYHIERNINIHKASSTRGYFFALAGARYMYVLLPNTTANLTSGKSGVIAGGLSTMAHDGETVTYAITPTSTLGTKLNPLALIGNEKVTVLVEEWIDGKSWTNGNYQVTATYSS
jgi:hypothetical protein